MSKSERPEYCPDCSDLLGANNECVCTGRWPSWMPEPSKTGDRTEWVCDRCKASNDDPDMCTMCTRPRKKGH